MKCKTISKIIVSMIMALSLGSALSQAQEPIDRIVAIVDQEPILASELAAQIQMAAIQQGLKPESEEELEQMQLDILESMINERLFLIEAKKDTMISIGSEEIDMAIDQHIGRVASQFATEEQFLTELSKEGMDLRQFKKKMRPDIENQLYKQRLIQMKLSKISVSQQEVNEFFEEFRDSIPEQPEAIRLSHILITFQPSGKTEDSVKALAEGVRSNIVSGADFISMAIQHSTGPSSSTGGDIGYVSPDDVIPEFGNVAFKLEPGDISGVVRTAKGYHIIKCEDKANGRAHLRHILFGVAPTSADSLLSFKLIDSLLGELDKGEDFKELAKVYSADDDSRKQGGELGWFASTDLPPGFQMALKELGENESYYGPVRTDYGLHILKKIDYQEAKTLSPEEDFDQLKELAKQSKTGEFVDSWLEKIKEKTYVEIKL